VARESTSAGSLSSSARGSAPTSPAQGYYDHVAFIGRALGREQVSIEEEIASWAATRPSWQQTVLVRLAGGHTFSDAEIRSIAAQLTAGTQGSGGG